MPLPHCHSRHELPGEKNWFACSHPQVISSTRRVSGGFCRICQYSSQPPPAQPVHTGALQRAERATPCAFLGDHLGERLCATCCKTVRVKVFACSHSRHSETTVRECELCSDYEAISGGDAIGAERILDEPSG